LLASGVVEGLAAPVMPKVIIPMKASAAAHADRQAEFLDRRLTMSLDRGILVLPRIPKSR